MCGIAGFSLIPEADTDGRLLAASLALSIERRGRHATGIAWYDEEAKTIMVEKAPLKASDFVQKLWDVVPTSTKHAIIHTRAATQGSPDDNNNNHPINLPGIAGVHNGMLVNDGEVSKKLNLDRVGEVDSEVIFHIIRYHGGVEEVGRQLDGDAAIAWMSWDDVTQRVPINVAHLGGRTAVWARIYSQVSPYEDQGIMFASTAEALLEAALDADVAYDLSTQVQSGTHIVLHEGELQSTTTNIPRISRPVTSGYDWDAAEGSGSGSSTTGSSWSGRNSTWKGNKTNLSTTTPTTPVTSTPVHQTSAPIETTSTQGKTVTKGQTRITRYHANGTMEVYHIDSVTGQRISDMEPETGDDAATDSAETDRLDALRQEVYDQTEAQLEAEAKSVSRQAWIDEQFDEDENDEDFATLHKASLETLVAFDSHSSADEWELEDENEHGDELWYNLLTQSFVILPHNDVPRYPSRYGEWEQLGLSLDEVTAEETADDSQESETEPEDEVGPLEQALVENLTWAEYLATRPIPSEVSHAPAVPAPSEPITTHPPTMLGTIRNLLRSKS